MRAFRNRGGAIAAVAIAAAASLATPDGVSSGLAQDQPDARPTSQGLRDALMITRTRGVATLAVFTTRDQPASLRLWSELRDGDWARTHRGLVQLVEVSKDQDPALVQSLGVARFPTVIAYGCDAKGPRVIATMSDCSDIGALTERIRALDLGLDPAGRVDAAVVTTSFHPDALPSQQYPEAAPAAPQYPSAPPQSPPQAPPQPVAPSAPAYAPTLYPTTPAGLIQVPSQNFVIQQGPPQIFMTPMQAPIVYMPQAAAPVAPVAGPAGNMFLPPAAPVAPAVMAPVAPVAPTAMVPVSPSVPATVTNQTLSMPTTRAVTRVRVRGPGLVRSGLARLGEQLTLLGRARVQTIQETTLESPFTQTAGSGLTTISTTLAAPIAPVQQTNYAPTAPAPPAAPPASPQAPLPSPQGGREHHHTLFHHDE
jgi:hypothetical protein